MREDAPHGEGLCGPVLRRLHRHLRFHTTLSTEPPKGASSVHSSRVALPGPFGRWLSHRPLLFQGRTLHRIGFVHGRFGVLRLRVLVDGGFPARVPEIALFMRGVSSAAGKHRGHQQLGGAHRHLEVRVFVGTKGNPTILHGEMNGALSLFDRRNELLLNLRISPTTFAHRSHLVIRDLLHRDHRRFRVHDQIILLPHRIVRRPVALQERRLLLLRRIPVLVHANSQISRGNCVNEIIALFSGVQHLLRKRDRETAATRLVKGCALRFPSVSYM